jgi:hypothetical protein
MWILLQNIPLKVESTRLLLIEDAWMLFFSPSGGAGFSPRCSESTNASGVSENWGLTPQCGDQKISRI